MSLQGTAQISKSRTKVLEALEDLRDVYMAAGFPRDDAESAAACVVNSLVSGWYKDSHAPFKGGFRPIEER